jgi:hypothetical protein
MATLRFYLPSSGTAAFDTLDFSAYWTAIGSTHYHLPADTSKTSTAQVYRSNYVAAGEHEALFQFISTTLDAATVTTSDTLKLQMRALTDSTAANPRIDISVRVVSGDGSVVRGTVYEGNGPTAISQSAWTNRSLGSAGAEVTAQNEVGIQSGDRFSIEIGTYHDGATSVYPYTGDAEASDLPENETSTDAYNPWFEITTTEGGSQEKTNVVCMCGVI